MTWLVAMSGSLRRIASRLQVTAVSQRQDDSGITTHLKMSTLALFEVTSPAQVRKLLYKRLGNHLESYRQPSNHTDRQKRERKTDRRKSRLIEN